MSTGSPLLIICNPKSGDGQGPAFVNEHVLPLLARHNIRIDTSVVTSGPDHAGDEVVKFIHEHEGSPITLILAGGDGTLHEIINTVYSAGSEWILQVSIALVPAGTANALYSSIFSSVLAKLQANQVTSDEYKLCSVRSLFRDRSEPSPLTITRTTVRSPAQTITSLSYSAVVTSTALHASILHDSESLRDQIPDLSRFKIAAQRNITRWYKGIVKLYPAEGSKVFQYDCLSGRFVPLVGDENNPSEPILHGPFAYFLSTVNVDRLEPSFVISPLHSRIRAESNAMDIVIIRPHQDPSIPSESDSENDHSRFAEKLGLALHAAYRDGAHVELTYSEDGTVQDSASRGSTRNLIEYIRCAGGWRWLNTDSDTTHLCVDGTIYDIEAGGEAECQIIDTSRLHFYIFA